MKRTFFLTLTLLFLLAPVLNVTAVAPQAYGHEIVVAATTSDEQISAIAYNSLRSEMLVVWQVDAGNGNYDIWARRGRHMGPFQWLGEAFVVAASATSEDTAAVAYNSSDDDYLVVYEYQFTASDHDIFGQRVAGRSGEGDQGGELKGSVFSIGGTTGSEQNPDVAYLPSSQHFLVVYELDGDIWGRRVARQHLGDNGGDLIAAEFAIAADFEHNEAQPQVLASTQQSYFLVAYAYEFASDDWDIRGQRVRGLYTDTGQIMAQAFDVAFTSDSETNPGLGYSQNAQAFIVVWQADAANNSDVRAVWLDERIQQGNPAINTPFVVSEDLVAQEQQPAVDVDPANGDVAIILSYIPDEVLLARIGTVWLNADPTVTPHITRPLSLYPERPFAVTHPLIKLCHGQPGMMVGFDAATSSEHDAYLIASSRWTTLLPLILHG